MSNRDAGCDIRIKKQLLDCDLIRMKGIQQGHHIIINLLETKMERQTGRRADRAVLNMGKPSVLTAHHAIANNRIAGINSKYYHAFP